MSNASPEVGPKSGSVAPTREVGRLTGDAAGPTLITVGAIHGNEPAGIEAAKRILALLSKTTIRGEYLALGGNLGAMHEGRRYRFRDMNRVWTEAHIRDVRTKKPEQLDAEDLEQLDLLDAIRSAIGRARGPVYLVDLHTTSAHGVPFALFGDTLRQRNFTRGLPLPIIMGLEEQLDGVLSEYCTKLGVVTFAVEGGQHADPGSVDNLEAVVLLAAQTAGIFEEGSLSETRAAYALLESRRGSLPRVMEVVSRHAITPEDSFVMEPGFKNLDHARAGQVLAHDRKGAIRAPADGLVMLPLYQGQGADGFFWGRAVSPARMRASEMLRQLHLDRVLAFLPGIERDEANPTRFIVDRLAASLYPRDVFHMLGYRRIRQTTGNLTVERAAD